VSTRDFEYRGINRRGAGVYGRGLASFDVLGDFVESKFRQGWRKLTVTRDGDRVGEISVLDGQRIWWSE